MKNKKLIAITIICLAVACLAVIGISREDDTGSGQGNNESVETKDNENDVQEDDPNEEVSEKTNTNETNGQGQDKEVEKVVEEPGQVEIMEEEKASYERWLAAGMVTAISMEYQEFEIEGIYLASETELNRFKDSQGAYVIFTSGGVEGLFIQSLWMKKEMKEEQKIYIQEIWDSQHLIMLQLTV
ncbi:MAG: hypothetical protein V8S08_03360 [Lachnoclostridium sp.]